MGFSFAVGLQRSGRAGNPRELSMTQKYTPIQGTNGRMYRAMVRGNRENQEIEEKRRKEQDHQAAGRFSAAAMFRAGWAFMRALRNSW